MNRLSELGTARGFAFADIERAKRDLARAKIRYAAADGAYQAQAAAECLCWVGHGSCGGCSGVIGIAHEPSCGWEQHPDCPVHP